MAKKNFYAVRVGITPGIYKTWDECSKNTSKFPGAVFKGFESYEEAEAFIRIGRSLIINRNYIYYINLNRQLLLLREPSGRRHETMKVSHESLKKLKELIEG